MLEYIWPGEATVHAGRDCLLFQICTEDTETNAFSELCQSISKPGVCEAGLMVTCWTESGDADRNLY
jgi:hypothetical protein